MGVGWGSEVKNPTTITLFELELVVETKIRKKKTVFNFLRQL